MNCLLSAFGLHSLKFAVMFKSSQNTLQTDSSLKVEEESVCTPDQNVLMEKSVHCSTCVLTPLTDSVNSQLISLHSNDQLVSATVFFFVVFF